MKTSNEIRRLLKIADKASEDCQIAYGQGNMAEGQRLELLANETAKRYQDACEESPENAPMTSDQ